MQDARCKMQDVFVISDPSDARDFWHVGLADSPRQKCYVRSRWVRLASDLHRSCSSVVSGSPFMVSNGLVLANGKLPFVDDSYQPILVICCSDTTSPTASSSLLLDWLLFVLSSS